MITRREFAAGAAANRKIVFDSAECERQLKHGVDGHYVPTNRSLGRSSMP